MKVSFLILTLFTLFGCASNEPCTNYVGSFVKLNKPPEAVVTDQTKNFIWYKKTDGDYFACNKLINKNYCGSVHHEFILLQSGKYKNKEIVCVS